MGCFQSKGVAPVSSRAEEPSQTLKRSDAPNKEAWQSTAEVSAVQAAPEAPQASPCSASQTNTQADTVELTPRGEDLFTTTSTTPAAAATSKSQPDPEFDYTQELSSIPAVKPAFLGTATATTGPLGPLKPKSGALAPLGSTSTVAGLLTRQPDWLKEPKAPLPPVATFSNSATTPAVPESAEPRRISLHAHSGSNTNGPPGPIPTASSLPPLAKLGNLAAASARPSSGSESKNSTLSAMQSVELPQHVDVDGVAAGGPRGVDSAGLPEPRRLTGNLSKGKGHADAAQGPAVGSQHCISDAAAEGSGTGAAAARHEEFLDVGNHQHNQQIVGAQEDNYDAFRKDGSADHCGRRSSSSSRSTSSSPATAAQPYGAPAASSSAPPAAAYDPTDPWSALQHQYAAAGGPPSPEHTTSGSATHRSDQSTGPQQHRRTSGVSVLDGSQAAAANTAVITRKSGELVLVGSDDEDLEDYGASGSDRPSVSDSNTKRMGGAVTSSSAPPVAAESSRAMLVMAHKVGKPTTGSWGAGSMAAAGTIMLGDSNLSAGPSQRTLGGSGNFGHSKRAAANQQHDADDVFGDETPHDARLGAEYSSRIAGVAANSGVGSEASGTSSRLQADGSQRAVGGAAEMELSVEDIDDVDAMIEAELAAKNALPGDLAAKLAQFEAMADDDD